MFALWSSSYQWYLICLGDPNCKLSLLLVGVIYNGHVSCPWHAACFSIRTGDIEDFPGCDSIPAFEVTRRMTFLVLYHLSYITQTIIKDGTVYVKAEENQIIAKRSKPLTPRNILSRETIVIVGGGMVLFESL